ncbi:hypothetical protein [Legionella taurinensis]|uniref:hypothetical protein n=1 Tax=Legionella taurinensis TaxID=70611 RepID=UPI0010A9F7FC|nr:hypothetical protein [Legionella taurinensis]MDX1836483.1 hypothetical protein [Legionella taurinensis]
MGYYIFLGHGDYHPSDYKTKDWVSEWNLEDWIQFIHEIKSLGSNTLMLYLNGHTLPYRSQFYPQLVDVIHPNCQQEFLSELLHYAKELGFVLIAVLTTTGHAGKFSELNEASQIETSTINLSIEETLTPFPEHLRRGKLLKQEGAAQVGYGVLCHNKEISRTYSKEIVIEIIQNFGDIIDGIALHPPESISPCCCIECLETFFITNKCEMNLNDISAHREFFITSYLRFQSELHSLIARELPQCQQLTFTIPWLYENSFDALGLLIPRDVIIIEWDYNLNPARISSVKQRIEKYRSLGHTLWFMPTAGFSFDPQEPIHDQLRALYYQLEVVETLDVDGIIHFLGPKKSAFINETSIKTFKSIHISSN